MRNLKNQHNFFETGLKGSYNPQEQAYRSVYRIWEGGEKIYKKSFIITFPFNIPENGVEGGVFSTITLKNASKLPSKHL